MESTSFRNGNNFTQNQNYPMVHPQASHQMQMSQNYPQMQMSQTYAQPPIPGVNQEYYYSGTNSSFVGRNGFNYGSDASFRFGESGFGGERETTVHQQQERNGMMSNGRMVNNNGFGNGTVVSHQEIVEDKYGMFCDKIGRKDKKNDDEDDCDVADPREEALIETEKKPVRQKRRYNRKSKGGNTTNGPTIRED